VEKIGQVMFAAYLVSVIIVLVNILIAMMSNTFEKIQVQSRLVRLFAVQNYIASSSSSSCESTNFNELKTPALGCVCIVSCVLGGFANINICAVKLKGGGPPAPEGWGATPIHCI